MGRLKIGRSQRQRVGGEAEGVGGGGVGVGVSLRSPRGKALDLEQCVSNLRS